MKKIPAFNLLTIVLILTIVLPVLVQSVAGESPPGFIRITADGSVVETYLIQRNGDTYTFKGNISGGIAVEKDNIVIDGAGYTLQGPGKESHDDGGLFLDFRSNVTIKNLHITACQIGIRRQFGNCVFEGNYITDCSTGIDIGGVYGNNTFTGNTITSPVSFNYGGGGNFFYGNNFVDGGWVQGGFAAGKNTFDGNYWEVFDTEGMVWVAYNSTDADGDGIGDTPHVVYDDSVDNHPLMKLASNQWLSSSEETTPSSENQQQDFPVSFVAVASGVSVAIIGIGLFLYFNKRGRSQKP